MRQALALTLHREPAAQELALLLFPSEMVSVKCCR